MTYLNVGHTGLDNEALPAWISKHGLRAVHLIHDIIPISNPEFCRPGEAAKHRKRMTIALRSATGIIGNSQATLDELKDFAESQSLQMPRNIAAWISGLSHGRDNEPAMLEQPYFLTVGTIEARKNHLMLLQIWKQLTASLGESVPTLVIVGQPGWEAEEALRILGNLGELEVSVRLIGDCSDDELRRWIAGAEALLMPSFAEGFGLPIIEALSLVTPVIASALPVFREIAGDIPAYVPAGDSAAWLEAIRGFGDTERDRQLNSMRGYDPPTWRRHFEIVEEWLGTF